MNRTAVLILGTDSAFLGSSPLISLLQGSQEPFEPVGKFFADKATDDWKSELDQVLKQTRPEVVIFAPKLDRMPAASHVLERISELGLSIPVLVLIENAKADEVTRILNAGASDFARLPLDAGDLLPRLCRLKSSCRRDSSQFPFAARLDKLITRNVEFNRQLQQIPIYAKHDVTVLITGETGTGKELIASALHRLSARAGKTFVPVNCGAIPADLIENEFFGHESQAFTGASSRRAGLVSEADGGTLFLDEIDSAPLPFQAKLLRLLQNQEFRPVGSAKLCRADVRIIAAANSDLESAIAQGKFRQDLFYRLNVLRIDLPPLRKRLEDVPLLAQHFLQKYSALFRKRAHGISNPALEFLLSYSWPGNIRELENIIQRAVILCEGNELSPSHIGLPFQARPGDKSFRAQKAAVIAEFEKSYLIRLLTEHHGNITKAALAAGKHRRALFQLVQKHGIRITGDCSRLKPERVI